jgi:hypothetical protein
MRTRPSASRASVVGRFRSAFAAGPPFLVTPGEAGSGDGRNRPARVDAADSVVVLIGDEDAVRGVDDDPRRMVELPVGRRTAVARETSDARACHRRDDPVGSDLADAIAQVGDEHVARRIDGHAHGAGRAAPRTLKCRCPRYPATPVPASSWSLGAGTVADATPGRRGRPLQPSRETRLVTAEPPGESRLRIPGGRQGGRANPSAAALSPWRRRCCTGSHLGTQDPIARGCDTNVRPQRTNVRHPPAAGSKAGG